MANTRVFSGSFSITATGVNTVTGDEAGVASFGTAFTRTLKTGASAPEIEVDGGWEGVATVTTTPTSIQVAHATDPLQGLGDVAPAQGYVPTGKKLRALKLENLSAADSITASIPATLGLAGTGLAANDKIAVLQPRAGWGQTFPNNTTGLTAGTNDAIALVASANTPQLRITVYLGA